MVGVKATSEPTWLVIGLARNLYSGGSIRAGMIFKDLCANERAVAVRGRSLTDALRGLAGHPGMIRGPVNLATAGMMPRLALKAAARLLETVAIDVHDHPVLQAAALGLPQSSSAASKTLRSYVDHVAAFRVLIAQTESFADLAGLPSDRTLIIPNGTDPGR